MATPNPEVLFVFDGVTGAPYTGGAGGLSFLTYVNDGGTPVSPPAITKIADGIFKFTPVFSSRGIFYMVDTGGQNPPYLGRYARPEEAYTDQIVDIKTATDLISAVKTSTDTIPALTTSLAAVAVIAEAIKDFHYGKWEIKTSGPDVNRLVIYAVDGITPLIKFNLFDRVGSPTSSSAPYKKVPV